MQQPSELVAVQQLAQGRNEWPVAHIQWISGRCDRRWTGRWSVLALYSQVRLVWSLDLGVPTMII